MPVDDNRGVIFGDIVFGLFLLYFFYKYFRPMFNGQIALELNDTGIYDFIRNQNVTWDNVIEIRKVSFGKGSFGLGIVIADKKQFIEERSFSRRLLCYFNNFFYSTPFIIPLQFLAGSDNEIVETVQTYFMHRNLEDSKGFGNKEKPDNL
ncbi:MAG: hypothetical protein HY252_07765 [Sphingobacteriales bacterium]|nr:hypothetical protein [Sphingobacteriales bacterium]